MSLISDSGATLRRRNRQSSVSSLRKLHPIRLADPFLERQLAEDDAYMNVLCVRDEIIENALDHCSESYIKTQSVKFLVDCLHKAYINVINTVHMHYDTAVIDATHNLWVPDPQFEPLPLDNYCEFSVPFVNKIEEAIPVESPSLYIDEELEPAQLLLPSLLSTAAADDAEVAEDDMETSAFIEANIEATMESTREMFSDSQQFEDMSCYMDESVVSGYEEAKVELASSTTELYEEITSQTSFFTGVAEATNNFLPPIEQLRCDYPLVKTGESQGSKSPFRVTASQDAKKYSFIGLPPLRLKAKFKPSESSRSIVRFGRSMTSSLDKFARQSSLSKSVSALKDDSDFDEGEDASPEKKANISADIPENVDDDI